MPANDDVFYFQCFYGVFNCGRFTAWRAAGKWNHVACIAADEQIARFCLCQQVWVNTGIGATDKQRLGRLPTAELSEEGLFLGHHLVAEPQEALNDPCHDFIPLQIDALLALLAAL